MATRGRWWYDEEDGAWWDDEEEGDGPGLEVVIRQTPRPVLFDANDKPIVRQRVGFTPARWKWER